MQKISTWLHLVKIISCIAHAINTTADHAIIYFNTLATSITVRKKCGFNPSYHRCGKYYMKTKKNKACGRIRESRRKRRDS